MGKWLEFMDVRPWARADLQLFDFDLINMPCKAGHIVHGKWTMFTIPVKVTVLLELRLLAMLAEPSSTAVFRGSVCASTLALSTVGISGVQALGFWRSAIIACVATGTGLVHNSLEFPMLLGFSKLTDALRAMLSSLL